MGGGQATHPKRSKEVALNPEVNDDQKRTLDRLVIDVLRALQAQETMVPGAKLRQKMVQAGSQRGLDVDALLAALGRPFSKTLAEMDGVVITPVPGSDILVGLPGAKPPEGSRPPPSSSRQGLRQDVFEAFTRISAVPFVYMPERDKFVAEDQAEGPSVRVPAVSLEQAVASRREFAESLPETERGPLLKALERSATPLAQFRQVVRAEDLVRQWAKFQARNLEALIRRWAEENHVRPRSVWFTRQRTEGTARHVLQRLAPYLTADEIRELRIPLRAVEAMLSGEKSA